MTGREEMHVTTLPALLDVADGCALCAQAHHELAGDELHSCRRRSAAEHEPAAVLESERFVVFPSIGALVPGHVIVAPRHHARSWVALDRGERDEAAALIDRAGSIVRERGDAAPRLFEHGSAADGPRVACSIEHAHVHLLPVSESAWQTAIPALPWSRPLDFDGLAAAVGRVEYLRVAVNGGWAVATSADGFRSQLMRGRLAEALDLDGSSDWREDPRLENVEATYDWFSGAARFSGRPSTPNGRTSERVSIQTRAPQVSGSSGR